MDPAPKESLFFNYRAQSADGRPMVGTLQALDADEARWRLQGLGLRILDLSPDTPVRTGRALRGSDFAAFNEQLASLASAGLPIEQGLRLVAQDMRGGSLARAIRSVADELEKGHSLAEAFQAHAKGFPPLYSNLLEAGVRSGRLAGMLMNMGRHLELMGRLRRALWQTMAYPAMVLVAAMLVLVFLSTEIIPNFKDIFVDFDTSMPDSTLWVLAAGRIMPWLALAILVLVVAAPLVWGLLRAVGCDRALVDFLTRRLPLLSPVLRRNVAARWCDTVRLGVEADLSLPTAMEMAWQAIGLPSVESDSRALADGHVAGTLADLAQAGRLRILPPTLPAAMDHATRTGSLDRMLGSMAAIYEDQAAHSLGMAMTILGPAMVVVLALMVGGTIVGLFMPLVALIQAVTG